MRSKSAFAKLNLLIKGFTCLAFLSLVSILINFLSYEKIHDDRSKTPNTHLIQTEGCTLFETSTSPVQPKDIQIPNCNYEETLSTINDELQVLQMSDKYVNASCCFHTIRRVEGKDDQFTVSNCTKVGNRVDVKDEEMFFTKCGHHLNFDANLKMTSNVYEKMKKWETVPSEEIPVSVLFFGIDSISRAMAHRSIPKTIEFMKKIGFIDFKGYHSAGPGTLCNFMHFLVGENAEVGGATKCHQNLSDSFDNCEFIWKSYSQNDYVTMYTEDAPGSFNHDNNGGFQNKPTDFYIHSLFTAMKEIREKETYSVLKIGKTLKNLLSYAYCASRDSVPEFMKKYNRRFLSKFINVPTFSFTWFAHPFHEYMDEDGFLPEYDQFFLDLFQFLNSTSNILDDNLIVFVSDHGSRYGLTRKRVDVGRFIELNLPFLFVRIPEKLLRKYPNDTIMQAVLLNSERLTSPLDLHSTFLHILHLGKQNAPFRTNVFKADLLSRSSLLFPVNQNRTCMDFPIPQVTNCVCNIQPDITPVKDKNLLKKMNIFVVEQLNQFVKNSNYSDICEEWMPTGQYSGNILRTNPNYMEILFRFSVNPGSSGFQVTVRSTTMSLLELSGEFLRTTKYGNQSWCIHTITHVDKKMKALCFCKSKKS